MTLTSITRREVEAALPVLPSYRSLVWAIRFTTVALAAWVVIAIGGADMWTVVGLACPMLCLLLLLGTIVAVVSSQVTPELADDSAQHRLLLVGAIIAGSARHALIGLPRQPR